MKTITPGLPWKAVSEKVRPCVRQANTRLREAEAAQRKEAVSLADLVEKNRQNAEKRRLAQIASNLYDEAQRTAIVWHRNTSPADAAMFKKFNTAVYELEKRAQSLQYT